MLETLLGSDGERELFRKTYPFSPALVQALIAASSVLQRERTALKLMLTLLVKRRDELRLGALIPVGDLWDEIAAGDQPFSDGMRIEFDNAKKLWTQKLLPMLEQVHGVTWQELLEGHADPQVARHFENDARLLKTLLLAALVPEVPALAGAHRGAAGGAEPRLGGLAGGGTGRRAGLAKLRGWAARVGEIRVSEDTGRRSCRCRSPAWTSSRSWPTRRNPTTTARAAAACRRSCSRHSAFPADSSLMGAQPFVQYEHSWRGTKRPVDLYFEVVKGAAAYDRLRGRPGAPVLVLGMPFDPKGRPPADHLAHARRSATTDAAGRGGVAALLPQRSRHCGTWARWCGSTSFWPAAATGWQRPRVMLSVSDREQAQAVLRSQQSALHERLRTCVETAYGIRDRDTDGCLGTLVPAEDRLESLDTFQPRTPIGATMKDAVGALLDSLFDYRYPAHPKFDEDLIPARLRLVEQEVQKAAIEPDQRILMDRPVRDHMRAIAVPLQLGAAGQTHFQLSSHWADHFARMQARMGGSGPMTVKQLREWMNEPQPMGLQEPVQNLVVLAFAAQADRTLLRRGAPAQVSLDRIEDDVELHEQPLPDEDIWTRARERAGALFGLVPSEVRKGATVAKLASELKTAATEQRPVLTALAQALQPRCTAFDLPTSASRLVTLRSAQTLLGELGGASDPLAVINALASAELATSEAAVQRCLCAAAGLRDAVNGAAWDIITAGTALSDARRAASEALRTYVAAALESDEHVTALAPALTEATRRASRLLQESCGRRRRLHHQYHRSDRLRLHPRRRAKKSSRNARPSSWARRMPRRSWNDCAIEWHRPPARA